MLQNVETWPTKNHVDDCFGMRDGLQVYCCMGHLDGQDPS